MERLETALTQLLSIDVPVIQAPIGSAATPELAAAVSNGGGLGMLSITWTSFAYSAVPPLPGMAGDVEALAFYARQSAGLANRVLPAAELLRDTVREALEGLSDQRREGRQFRVVSCGPRGLKRTRLTDPLSISSRRKSARESPR